MLKPATIERLCRHRAAEQKARRADLMARLTEKVKQEGPGTIWAEMLAELARQNLQNS